MTITYVETKFGIDKTLKVPKLHRVAYANTLDGVPAQWQVSYKDYCVNQWLKDNCRHPYYHSPGYVEEKFIEFECDEEAVLFALRWA